MGSGFVPEFGAIFMSHRRTRQECFDRKLLGLPFQFANFVKAIKPGMILFLYEYENKVLYGVFEAISDGAVDIVPHAYSSSGRKFPAQVKFRVIWNCIPLPEEKFCDAIKENYYTAHRFNFGLSNEQVHRLLCLFDSMKIRVQKSLTQERMKHWARSSRKLIPSANSEILGAENGASTIDSEGSKSSAGPSESRSESVDFHNKTEQLDASAGSAALGLEDYIPLSSSESPKTLKVPIDNDLKVKCLYSDIPKQKASVFTRLKMTPKVDKGEKIEVDECKNAYEIMERLLQRQEDRDTNKKRKLSFSSKKSHLMSNLSTPSRESSAGKENHGSCELSIRTDAVDGVEIPLSQKKELIPSDGCTPITATEPPITYIKPHGLSMSPSVKGASETANESTLMFSGNQAHCEQHEEEEQPKEVQPSFPENSIYPVLKSKVGIVQRISNN